jgi:hypothetical protein
MINIRISGTIMYKTGENEDDEELCTGTGTVMVSVCCFRIVSRRVEVR